MSCGAGPMTPPNQIDLETDLNDQDDDGLG